MTKLCPAQQSAFDHFLRGLSKGSVFRFWSGIGCGKSTVIREAHAKTGGALITTKDFLQLSANKHPLALEETLFTLGVEALNKNDTVYIDDFHLIDLCSGSCHFYPRSGFSNSVANALCSLALDAKKKLILATNSRLPDAAVQRSYSFGIDRFKPEDYFALARVWLPEKKAATIDFQKVFRFAPKLNAHQIKAACLWLVDDKKLGTEKFIDYLRYNRLASNVDLAEVQEVDLKDLRGVSEVIRNLEINIVHPLENDALANELGLRSKHGVLLYGPPGTGKTTVGRALARRLKGKFFLIDGTFIAGSDNFYGRVHQVFEAAKENAPSVIFIDDADAIFEDGEERGLYRYLLTMLDGLESESAGRVCVVMTAMNIAHLPPALVRSGRIELWLEMTLPDAQARDEILAQHIAALPAQLQKIDTKVVCSALKDFTGADIKRTIEDGKAIYAYDRSRNSPIKSPTEYFMQAAAAVAENKKRYAEAEAGITASRAMNSPSLSSIISRHFVDAGNADLGPVNS